MPDLAITPATDDEIVTYLGLRDTTAAWMLTNGIVQWQPGELTPASLHEWVGDGQVFAARAGGVLVGGVMVMWADEFWENDDGDAGYTHGLLVDRALKGQGLGARLLAFAEAHIAENGRRLARLDTVTTNSTLRRYYRDAGYREVGETTFETGKALAHGAPIESVTLFEKVLR